MPSGTTYEVVTVDRPFRELALAFEVTDHHDRPGAQGEGVGSSDELPQQGRRLALHLVDSADYPSCASFLASPTGVGFCASRGVGPDACVPAPSGCAAKASGSPHAWTDACASACGLPSTPAAAVHAQRRRHVVASWEFDGGSTSASALEGWANATASEMEAEVYARGGELRGVVEGSRGAGSAPHFDSPLLQLQVDGKHHLVFRMLYSGPAKVGRALFRSSGAVDSDGASAPSSSNWSPLGRPNATAVRWSAGSTGAAGLVDGSPHSGWRAPTSHDAWVVVDLGGVFAVTELDLVVAFGAHSSGGGSSGHDAPQSVRLQVGASPDSATFQTVLALAVPHPNATRRAANGTNGTATVEEDSFFADGFTNAPQYSARSAAAAGANGRTPGDINPRYSAVRFLGYTTK
jgi:hypothetical protein